MYLVEDMDDARLRYIGLGFVPVPTEDDGCCGISAGQTHIILINRDHAERTLPPRAVALLEERPALYVWVEVAGRGPHLGLDRAPTHFSAR